MGFILKAIIIALLFSSYTNIEHELAATRPDKVFELRLLIILASALVIIL